MREQVGDAIRHLNRGEPERARRVLDRVLKQRPGDKTAASLIEQIDVAPEILLGRGSYPYTVKRGETLSVLAQRFLGSPLRFYALARYNGIDVPEKMQPGTILQIPGGKRRALKPRAPSLDRSDAPPPADAAPNRASRPPTAEKTPVPPPPPAPPIRATVDPARAAKLRVAGLEQMNRGAIDRAVSLLSQARRFDPGNPLIARDLQRALRIQQTVRAKP